MGDATTVAVIAAVPPTITALAAWYQAYKAKRQVTPSNGTRLAQIVEQNQEWIKLMRQEDLLHAAKLDAHIEDYESHQRHVCPNCLGIE